MATATCGFVSYSMLRVPLGSAVAALTSGLALSAGWALILVLVPESASLARTLIARIRPIRTP